MRKKNRQNDISRGIHTKQQLLTILSCHQGPDNSCEEALVSLSHLAVSLPSGWHMDHIYILDSKFEVLITFTLASLLSIRVSVICVWIDLTQTSGHSGDGCSVRTDVNTANVKCWFWTHITFRTTSGQVRTRNIDRGVLTISATHTVRRQFHVSTTSRNRTIVAIWPRVYLRASTKLGLWHNTR